MWVPFVISLQGLETALDLLHVGQRGGSLSSALLLTDGVPNVEPPGGHMEALERYKAAKGGAKPRGVRWLTHGLCDLVPHGWSQYVMMVTCQLVLKILEENVVGRFWDWMKLRCLSEAQTKNSLRECYGHSSAWEGHLKSQNPAFQVGNNCLVLFTPLALETTWTPSCWMTWRVPPVVAMSSSPMLAS